MRRRANAWCWGAGWDSSAGIIEATRRGERIDLITFANTGGEKNVPDPERGEEVGTYDFIPIFSDWCEAHGQPRPVICEYVPEPATRERYEQVTREVVAALGLTVDEDQLINLSRLYGNMVANDTLPGIAFGPKSCSIKWKLEAQEPH
jgi:hypothetical protein